MSALREAERRAAPSANGKPPPAGPNDAPDNPHRLADGFLASAPGPLVFWRGEFFRYDGCAYRPVSAADLKAHVTEFARGEFLAQHEQDVLDGKANARVRAVTGRLVNDVLGALCGRCLLGCEVEAPAWVGGATGPDPLGVLAVRNGLLDLAAAADGRADCLMPPSASFFTTTSAPFGFDPDAPGPAGWLRFLAELWPGDPESIETLQDWFGYCLGQDTRQQKILFVLGPRRSGKGTIARVMRELVGPLNVAGPTLGSLATNFGLSPLLGKSVAIVSDARLSGRADAAVITERLLSVSGEDALTVDRKHKEPVTVKLPTRFMILSNELPRLGDSSGALAGRLVLLRLTRSWYGSEDHDLFDRLKGELPGILLWALEGWRRLRDRGRFVQPQSGAELVEDMEDLSSPVGAFVRERCLLAAGVRVEVSELYREWRLWCEEHGRREPGTEETFGRDLRAAAPSVGRSRPRVGGRRVCMYAGVRVRTDSDPHPDDTPPGRGHPGQGGHGDPALHAMGQQNPEEAVEAAMSGHHDHPDHLGHSEIPW